MINEILEFTRLLCMRIEPTWLRRNSIFYNLVSYVNNLTILFIGEQYTDVALFIKRTDAELGRLEKEYGYCYEYFELVKTYMQRIVEYLLLNNLLSEIAMSLLPEKYQNHIDLKNIINENQVGSDLQILFNNYECKECSLVYYLHEEAIFNEQTFWDYYNSIISITKKRLGKPLDEKTAIAVVLTHKTIIESFLWHLTENDVYKITNYPSDTIQLYMERLHF